MSDHKRKKTGLHVFYERAVKEGEKKSFSNLILANHSNPRIIFQTLDSVINPSPCHFIDASQETCESFLDFFSKTVLDTRKQITPPAQVLHTSRDIHCYFSNFKHMFAVFNRNHSPYEAHHVQPSKFLKEVIDTVGPIILMIINSSLEEGLFPSIFKHAVVQPLKEIKPGSLCF